MESGLQSNEVRIPKAAPSITSSNPFIKQRSETGPPSLSSSVNPPDFDLGSPCQYFKSSFARSLSMHSNQTKSLDFGINFGLSRSATIREETTPAPCSFGMEKIAGDYSIDTPPPLPLSQPPTLNGSPNHLNQQQQQQHHSGINSRNVWSSSFKQNSPRRSYDSAEIEVLRLRKECQSLVEENRRLMGYASGTVGGNLAVPGNSPNIEAVILQTQVDTLQWQLKQVEASRQMYRAVMEEVVRFLERCHRNLDSMQNEQISRSKSIHYVCRNDSSCETNNPPSPRARSSTNLMETQNGCPAKTIEESIATTSPAASYNNFRDFTWRRSPKRPVSAHFPTTECDPEKLSQDAFRLLRTAQNLLNTQEPDLTQSKPLIELQYNTNSASPPPSILSHKTVSQIPSNNKQKSCQIDSETFCITFSRKMNMRESRLSLRSSTDGSVHSTSSSKTETDEENCSPPILKETPACSTEDESGFSSISSFQEIGLPLHSTMISPVPHHLNTSSSTSDESGESTTDVGLESRNSTLKASQSSLLSNVGLPIQHHNHRRWDSAPAVPPRKNLHLFSGLPGDDTPAVLWV